MGKFTLECDKAPVTGCGLSETGMFSYGYANLLGRRWLKDGDHELCKTRTDDARGEVVALFGVFDGRYGFRAAEYVKENLFHNIMKHPDIFLCTGKAIDDAYRTTDSEFLKKEELDGSSSSCLTAILVKDGLYVANVGNSRAVICRGGKAFAISRDHTPNLPDELQRIEDAGGFDAVELTRSFGARILKRFVIADPEIAVKKVDDTLEFLILASDGLWDKVTNEEAVSMVVPIQDPEEAAKRLVEEAYNRGSLDNITVMVVRFLADNDEQGPQQNTILAPSHKNGPTSLLFILCFLCIITFAPLLAILINRILH